MKIIILGNLPYTHTEEIILHNNPYTRNYIIINTLEELEEYIAENYCNIYNHNGFLHLYRN